ncbi:MAG: ABC transporter ATP-binding protein [Nocardioidaceae bacterium]|nr:ABC transporter ATP-binding protein [Nocardioidaceae bacterium]
MSGLEAHLVTTRGSFTVDVELRVGAGEVVSVLGPNGSGKTTVLRMLAGLLPLTSGHIRIGAVTIEEPTRGLRSPAQSRGVGLVPQESLLFPHLRVRDQVAFGPRHRGSSRGESRQEADGWLGRTGLSELAARRPAELSGGQARRVAIARALAARPGLLLLDEPLAALDVRAVLELRSFLRRHLADFDGPTVLVTHDALDALVLADRLVVLDRGRVVQAGAPRDVAAHPRSHHVAALVGLNLVQGTAQGRVVTVSAQQQVEVVTADEHDGAVFCSFRPTAVAVYACAPSGSPRNVWRGEITGMTPYGDAVRLEIGGGLPLLADVTATAVAELGLAPGSTVWSTVKATDLDVYPV